VEALSRLDCPLGQGYHFAKPLSAEGAAELLTARQDGLIPA
jgi:EAL domain-containing protein (putative c-di-GMP-specific phosphodiesterase class I)